jgi:hypothetical protein
MSPSKSLALIQLLGRQHLPLSLLLLTIVAAVCKHMGCIYSTIYYTPNMHAVLAYLQHPARIQGWKWVPLFVALQCTGMRCAPCPPSCLVASCPWTASSPRASWTNWWLTHGCRVSGCWHSGYKRVLQTPFCNIYTEVLLTLRLKSGCRASV